MNLAGQLRSRASWLFSETFGFAESYRHLVSVFTPNLFVFLSLCFGLTAAVSCSSTLTLHSLPIPLLIFVTGARPATGLCSIWNAYVQFLLFTVSSEHKNSLFVSNEVLFTHNPIAQVCENEAGTSFLA